MAPESLGFDNDKFEAVWHRVISNKAIHDRHRNTPSTHHHQHRERGGGDLCRLMDKVALNECRLRTLSATRPGQWARALMGMAEDNRRMLRRLRTMYFIMTGGAYRPDVSCAQFHTVTEGLRAIHTGALSAERGFYDILESSGRQGSETFREFADIQRRHAGNIERMLQRMMK